MTNLVSPDIVSRQNEAPRLNLDQIQLKNLLPSYGRHHLTFEAEYQGQRAFFRKPREPQFVAGSINEAQVAFHLFPKLPEINRQLEQANSPVRLFTAEPLAMVYREGQFEGSLHSWMDSSGYSPIHIDFLSDYSQLEGFELILNRWQEILKMTDFQTANKQIKDWLIEDRRYLKNFKRRKHVTHDDKVKESAHHDSAYVLNGLLKENDLEGIKTSRANTIKEFQAGFDEITVIKSIVFAMPLLEKERISLDTFGSNILAKKNTDGTINIFLSDYALVPFGGRAAQTAKPPVK